VLAHVNNDGAQARMKEEEALILTYDPPGNRVEVSLRFVRRQLSRRPDVTAVTRPADS
jgi:hypothetical protein